MSGVLPEFSIMESAEIAPPIPAASPSAYLRPGQMDHDIPDTMTLGIPATCIIRIGDKDVVDIRISDTSIRTTIRICDEMSVQLVDIEGGTFTIRSLSSERQAIEKGEFTGFSLQTGGFIR